MDLERIIKEKCSAFDTLTPELAVEIVMCAPALSLDECLDRCLLEASELTEAEMDFAKRLHKRGRANGVKDACDNLFMHMKTKMGGQSAIEYLNKVSSEFAMTAQKASAGGFQFQIVYPAEEQKS